MKKSLAIFFQIITVLIGIGVLVFMLWEPQLEGRNINATFSQVYFHDPFLIYVYIASIAFFIAVYQVFRLLGYIRRGGSLSAGSVRILWIIKYCAISLIGFAVGAELYFFIAVRGKDDIAGGMAMSRLVIFIFIIIAIISARLERRWRRG